MANLFPKLHNAAWPGVVGKGDGGEPPISLETMLDLTAAAEVDGVKFDGVDLFLSRPHISIDATDDHLKRLADQVRERGLTIGSVVAPIWQPTGGGSAFGSEDERERYLTQVGKACHIAKRLRELGVRPYGVVRIDSAGNVSSWQADPTGNRKRLVATLKQACDIATIYGERLAVEGEISWGGIHSWRQALGVLELVDRREVLGFQADMSHVLTFLLGINALGDQLLEDGFSSAELDEAWEMVSAQLRPWTIDFHVAQSDGTTHGSGSHDPTGKHCLPDDPNGKLDIPRHAGPWLRDDSGQLTKAFQHICWDGCMFPNATLMISKTWDEILRTMIAVREAHGWTE